ncbi:hypothetical protein IGI04_030284 [Brassica rapa subsp. trilocularis]|uniref:Uncharacterized protein n=1 Tax=Brassica rapa subsp. trilocularis TaxID=1813537 RepID=A0ABQ7LQ96_BRACM|nr:hypothetical protein IGI04_030284 [Brassica rapa subsp. trilocularis]
MDPRQRNTHGPDAPTNSPVRRVGLSKPSNSPNGRVGQTMPSNSPNGRVGSRKLSNSPVRLVGPNMQSTRPFGELDQSACLHPVLVATPFRIRSNLLLLHLDRSHRWKFAI